MEITLNLSWWYLIGFAGLVLVGLALNIWYAISTNYALQSKLIEIQEDIHELGHAVETHENDPNPHQL
jgi:hypothetical protein